MIKPVVISCFPNIPKVGKDFVYRVIVNSSRKDVRDGFLNSIVLIRELVRTKRGSAPNQKKALVKSILPHNWQFWLMCFVKRPGMEPVAKACLSSLQENVFMRGGMVLCRQMRLKRSRVCDVILLAPWEGMGVVTCWFRISKASLVVQSPEVAGFHRKRSGSCEWTMGTCKIL